MKQWAVGLLAGFAMCGASTAVAADAAVVGVAYVRIPAPDLEKTAKFYEAAFNMHEVMRVADHEIGLNVGADVKEATANPGARVILDKRMSPDDKMTMVLHTHDLAGVVARAKLLGATVLREPGIRPNGFFVAIVRDTAGNRVELLEKQ